MLGGHDKALCDSNLASRGVMGGVSALHCDASVAILRRGKARDTLQMPGLLEESGRGCGAQWQGCALH